MKEMVISTRAAKNKGIAHLLAIIKLTQDEVQYVLAGFNEPEDLVVMNNYRMIDKVYDDEKQLPMLKRLLLKETAVFLELYYMKN